MPKIWDMLIHTFLMVIFLMSLDSTQLNLSSFVEMQKILRMNLRVKKNRQRELQNTLNDSF